MKSFRFDPSPHYHTTGGEGLDRALDPTHGGGVESDRRGDVVTCPTLPVGRIIWPLPMYGWPPDRPPPKGRVRMGPEKQGEPKENQEKPKKTIENQGNQRKTHENLRTHEGIQGLPRVSPWVYPGILTVFRGFLKMLSASFAVIVKV